MNERELRASLSAVGPLLPVLIWRGRILDGKKRDCICGELGVVPRVQVLHSLSEACSALWAVHQDRAVAEAMAGGATGVQQIAELCSARVADVATLLAGQASKPKSLRGPRRTRSTKSVMVQFWAEPQFKHFVKRAGETEGLDLSATLRVAAWEYVQRHLARAPREGAGRVAPGTEWVKPPERRRGRGPSFPRY